MSASLLTVSLRIPNAMKSSVGSTLCWCALLCCLLFSLFDRFNPDLITKLPIGGSFDLHIRQQLVNSGNPCFQLEEPIRYIKFEWGRRFVPNASLSLVPSLSPSSNLSENSNGNPVLSLDPSFNPWDFSSLTQLPRDDDNDEDKDDDGDDDDSGNDEDDNDDDLIDVDNERQLDAPAELRLERHRGNVQVRTDAPAEGI